MLQSYSIEQNSRSFASVTKNDEHYLQILNCILKNVKQERTIFNYWIKINRDVLRHFNNKVFQDIIPEQFQN
jgi:hypothetical protein